MAKASLWGFTDIEVRKGGYRRELDTPLVRPVNHEDYFTC